MDTAPAQHIYKQQGLKQDGASQFLLDKASPTIEKTIMPVSPTLPLGCPPLAFKPPVHRKHDRAHHGKSSKSTHKRQIRTPYPDVPLRLLGSQTDLDSPEAHHISPTHSSPVTFQRRSDSSMDHQDSPVSLQRSDSSVEHHSSIEVTANSTDSTQNQDNADHVTLSNGLNPEHPKLKNKDLVTMTGTIRRGKKEDIVNVNLSRDELDALARSTLMDQDKHTGSKCGLRMGLHILILSLFYFPFALISSLLMSFYTGSVCWYNIYIYLSEEKSFTHKLLLCPPLIVFYPLLVVVFPVGIACYAAVIQISWYFSSWLKEIKDLDKNTFGWICEKMGIPQCAPYEVVILEDTALNATDEMVTDHLEAEHDVNTEMLETHPEETEPVEDRCEKQVVEMCQLNQNNITTENIEVEGRNIDGQIEGINTENPIYNGSGECDSIGDLEQEVEVDISGLDSDFLSGIQQAVGDQLLVMQPIEEVEEELDEENT